MTKYNRSTQSGDLEGAIERARKHRAGWKKGKAALVAASLVVAGGIIAGGVALARDTEPEEQVVATDQRFELFLDGEGNPLVGIEEIDMLNEEQTIFNSYFKAHQGSPTGQLVEIEGTLEEIVEKDGLAWLRMESPSGEDIYVHPTAVVSASYGEHPAEKLLRLAEDHNLRIDPDLLEKLSHKDKRDRLCTRVRFNYHQFKKTKQVLSELLMDGSVITVMSPLPKDWRPPTDEYLIPQLFEVPLSVLDKKTHDQLLFEVGYSFDTDMFTGSNLQERVINFMRNKRTGMSIDSGLWTVDVLKELGLELGEDDVLLANFLVTDDDVYFTTDDDAYFATTGSFYRLTKEGELEKLLSANGRFGTALPLPWDKNKALISAEGYDFEDPRFQSLFEVDLRTGDYRVVEFPGGSRGGKPELYASLANFTPDGRFLFIKRYGFHDEGGGIWVLDLNDHDYGIKKKVIQWDHMLMFTTFGYLQRYPIEQGDEPVVQPIAINGKEVEDSFAMTINHGWMTIDGMDSSIDVERVGRLVGWNPVIRYYERTEDSIRIFTTVAYSFESFMEKRPMAVYRTVIDLEGDNEVDLSELPVETDYLEIPEVPLQQSDMGE